LHARINDDESTTQFNAKSTPTAHSHFDFCSFLPTQTRRDSFGGRTFLGFFNVLVGIFIALHNIALPTIFV
jgi:hypothetical protein